MPGAGFKVADAYADFHIDVDSEIGRAAARLKAKGAEFAKMGENAGKAFSAGFGRGVDLDKGFEKNIESLRKRTNQLQRMGNQAGEGYGRGFGNGVNLRSAMVAQVAVVRSSRAAFANEGKQAGQAYARGFGDRRLSGPSIGSSTDGAEASGEASARAMARGFTRGSGEMDTATSRVAARTEAKFSALKFLGLSQGLPAAAAVGVAATAGIIAGAGALFLGLGVAGAMGAEKVSLAWINTGDLVGRGITEMSTLYEARLVSASEMVGKSFVRSTGLIQRGMVNSVDGVEALTGSVLNLAENALPGVVVASGRLKPVLEGVDSVLSNVGTGFSEMAVNASQGAEGSRKGLVILGDTLRTVEARVGTLMANLANGSSGPLNSFRYTIDQITGAAIDLTAQGSGAVGFFQGFSTGANGAITVARGLLGVINALPPQITQIGGTLSATSMIMSKFGVDAGAGWEGLGAKVKGAGNELKGAEKFAAKAGTAIGGMAAGALNPAALAVGALSVGLLVLGDRQEKAAAAAAEHRESVRALTDSIRQDNGALGEHSATVIANALASKNAEANTRAVGISMATATTAAMGNQRAMFAVEDATNRSIQALKGHGIESQRDLDGLKGLSKGLLQSGGDFASLGTEVGKYTESLFNGKNPAEAESLRRTLDLAGAIGEQAKAAREAYNGYQLQEQGLTGLTEAQIKARDATIEHTKSIYDQQNAELGYRGAVQSTKEAQETYNKVVKDGKLGTDEGTRATLALENAMGQQEQAAYNAAYANSTARTEQEKVKEATIALNRETVNLANGFNGPLPASLQNTISRMSVTEAQAAGLKVGVNNLGQAVYTLPNGKEIKLAAESQQAKDAIAEVQRQLNELRNKTVTLTINTTQTYSGTGRGTTPSYNGGARFSAEGNLFVPRGGDGASQPVKMFAGGGLARLQPLRGNRAEVIRPNTWRVVGDNMRFNELFAPLNGSNRTADLIMQAAEHEGLLATANEALAASRAGQTIHEDASFNSMSANADAYNEKLASIMYGQTGASPSAEPEYQAAWASWLPEFIRQQQTALKEISDVTKALGSRPPVAPITITPPASMDYELLASIVARKIFVRGR